MQIRNLTHGDLATALATALERPERFALDALAQWRRWEREPSLPLETLAASLSETLKDSAALRHVARLNVRERGGEVVRRPGTWILAGPVGTGKTLAAAQWAFHFGAWWVTAPEIGLAPHFKAAEELRALRSRSSLVIDEMGGPGSTSTAGVERLASLISMRHADGSSTVITTNLDQRAFASTYDGVDDPAKSRLLDRVRERGAWLDCPGRSLRGFEDAPKPGSGDPPKIAKAKRIAMICDRLRALERDPRESARIGEPFPSEIAAAIDYIRERRGDVEAVVSKILDARAAMLGQADELLERWRADGLEVEGDGAEAIVGGLLASKGGR